MYKSSYSESRWVWRIETGLYGQSFVGPVPKACLINIYPIIISPDTCKTYSLLAPTGHPALSALGKLFPFECCVGLNGRIWVNAESIPHILAVASVIINCEHLSAQATDKEVAKMVKSVVRGVLLTPSQMDESI